MNKIIMCPKCEWKPAGDELWTCSCGHRWHTFDTKGICPKCKKDWQTTTCLACHSKFIKAKWYHTEEDAKLIISTFDPVLRARKLRIENSLQKLGIDKLRFGYHEYLAFDSETWQDPKTVGKRMLIFYYLSLNSKFSIRKKKLISWFKSEGIWEELSTEEKKYLQSFLPQIKQRKEYSWYVENAITLAWALGIVKEISLPINTVTTNHVKELKNGIPSCGESISDFLEKLSYRDQEEIFEENILNEALTGYFRDAFFRGTPTENSVNKGVSLTRHMSLNWLRKFMGIKEWEYTDGST